MADDFHMNGSWWRGSSKDRFEGGTMSASTFTSSGQHSSMGSLFGWNPACTDSVSIISAAAAAADSSLVSSPAEWNNNQSLLRERGELGFRSMLQESGNSEDRSYEMDPAMYGSSSAILQSALENRPYVATENTYVLNSSTHELLPPLMTRTSPPKQPPHHVGHHLQFSNNAPFWNASMKSNNVRSSFAPSASLEPHQHFPIDEKPKNLSEANASNNIGSETSSKRTRNETPLPLPAFKVRKEKMGDRITALQQMVSPFGKTDTASVLSEAIEYIKGLHEQVNVLSAPYMKSRGPLHYHQQDKVDLEGQEEEQDLRSRGLCLVPVASTFPVTHEPTQLDFWPVPFGGPFR